MIKLIHKSGEGFIVTSLDQLEYFLELGFVNELEFIKEDDSKQIEEILPKKRTRK